MPRLWKHGIVVPILEGGHYRTIKLLSCHDITCSYKNTGGPGAQTVKYLFQQNGPFSQTQHGYRKNHSTETALTVVTDQVYRAMNDGQISIPVLLDQSQCFDVIRHAKLRKK